MDAQSTIDKVRRFLLENTTASSKLVKVGDSVLYVHNLKKIRHKLFMSSTEMQQLMIKDAWFRHLRKHHKNFVRLKCRTDVCVYCHKYDNRVIPMLRRLAHVEATLQQWRLRISIASTTSGNRCRRPVRIQKARIL